MNPACPKHPQYEVDISWRHRHPPCWACSVCRKILGLASHRSDTVVRRWPQGRKPSPRDMQWNGVDWSWVLRDV